MSFGPYRFSMATFAYEEIKRDVGARIESQPIIGARPSLHNAGIDDEKLDIQASFFPNHLPGNRGLSQLARIRQDVGASYPLIGNRAFVGDAFGKWALSRVRDKHTHLGPDGVGQKIDIDIELIFDGRGRSSAALSAFVTLFG